MDTSEIKKSLTEALELQLAVLESDRFSIALEENVSHIRKIADEARPNPHTLIISDMADIAKKHVEELETDMLMERVQELAVPIIVIHGLAYAQLAVEKLNLGLDGAWEEFVEAQAIYERVFNNDDPGIERFTPFLKAVIEVAEAAFFEHQSVVQ